MIRRLLAAALMAALLTTGCAATISPPDQVPPAAETVGVPVPGRFDHPSLVVIPALDVRDEIVPVRLNPDSTMEVPPVEVVGWYELGVKPGRPGPAVLAGHVNWDGVRGSFARIGELQPGDEIQLFDQDGDRLSFAVYDVVSFPKSQFDTKLVYGDTPGPELRLVTCSGPVVGNRYLDNTVVLARITGGE